MSMLNGVAMQYTLSVAKWCYQCTLNGVVAKIMH